MGTVEFNSQFKLLEHKLLPTAYRLTNNYEDARDLVQETAMRAFSNRRKFEMGTNFQAWVITIMRNTFINNYRKAVRANTIIDNTDEQYFLNTAATSKGTHSPDSVYSHKQISKVVEALEDEYRVPFQMYNTGFKYKEIAEELELPIGTIKSRIFLARKKLMLQLSDYK